MGKGEAGAVWVALALLTVATPVSAGEVSVGPDRPTRASSLFTVPPGLVQVEAGVAFLRDASGDRPLRRFAVEGAVRVGLLESVEVSLTGTPFVRDRSEGTGTSGLGDTTLGGKWRLVDDEGWRPALGIMPIVKFPTASRDKGLGSGRVDFGGILGASKDLGSLHVDLNLTLAAVSLPEAPGGLFLQRAVAAAFSYAVTDRISPFWELFYVSRDRPGGEHGLGHDLGVTFTLHRRLAVDLAGEFRIDGATPDWAVRTGLAVLLGPLPEEKAPTPTRPAPQRRVVPRR